MKRIIAGVLAAVLLSGSASALPYAVMAESAVSTQEELFGGDLEGTDLSWILAEGELRIEGTGAIPDFSSPNDVPWIGYASEIRNVSFENSTVSSIGSYAFFGCSALTSIEIPDTVTGIGNYAFSGCSGLTSLVIPDSVTELGGGAFSDCTGLEEVTLPAGITALPVSLFSGCSSLASIMVPEGVTTITRAAFSGCTALQEVSLPESLEMIDYVSSEDTAFPDTVTRVSYAGSRAQWMVISNIDHYFSAAEIVFGKESLDDTSGDGIQWSLNNDGLLTISGSGEMEACASASEVPWYAYRSAVIEVRIGEGITNIGPYAFSDCTNLVTVSIPESVTGIGNYAFSGCTGLTAVEIPDTVTGLGTGVFKDCTGLEQLTLSKGTATLPSSCFYGCTGLAAVEIPEGVTSIKDSVFYGCSALNEVTIPESLLSIAKSKAFPAQITKVSYAGSQLQWSVISNITRYFSGAEIVYGKESAEGSCGTDVRWDLDNDGTLTITGSGGMEQYSQAMDVPWYPYRSAIKAAVIGNGVTDISPYLFNGYSALTSVSIPDSVTAIGANSFYGCSGLTSLILPESLTEIGSSAFCECSGLTAVEIPEGMTSIGAQVFGSCTGLSSVSIPDSVTEIGGNAFTGCTGLTSLDLPAGLTEIGSYAFNGCSGITSVVLPQSVTSLGAGAFQNCTGLQSADLTSGITTIAKRTFSGCTALQEIILPESLVTVADTNAFPEQITKVTYAGSRAQWSVISNIAGCFTQAEIVYEKESVDGVCDSGVQWSLNNDGVLTVSGSGAMDTYASVSDAPWYQYRGSIVSAVIEDGVSSVSANAFKDYTSLVSIEMADSVSGMGNAVFSGCSSLQTVKFPAGTQAVPASAFAGCTALTSIEIPEGVNRVWGSAFSGCSSLQEISLPETLTNISSSNAFPTQIARVNYAGSRAQWSVITNTAKYFTNAEILYGKESIGGSCGTDVLWKLDNDGVLTITGSGDMEDYSSGAAAPWAAYTGFIQKASVGSGVTGIGYGAFSGCTALGSVELPDSLTTIGQYAFSGCTGLACVELPQGITALPNYAFSECSALTQVELPDGLTTIGQYAFTRCTGLTSISLPDSLTGIGAGGFYGCTGLTEITIPGSVTGIGTNAFQGCTGLSQVVFQEGVTSVTGKCFGGCTGLSSVTVPVSLTSFKTGLFADAALETVQYAGNRYQWVTGPGKLTDFDGVEILYGTDAYSGTCGENAVWTFYNDGRLEISGSGSMDVYTTSSDAPWYAIKDCITSVTVDGISDVSSWAFVNCSSLRTVTIGDSVGAIGKVSFAANSQLESIVIGAGVTKIDKYAFGYCPALKSVETKGSVPETSSFAFYHSGLFDGEDETNPVTTVTVPAADLDGYMARPWLMFRISTDAGESITEKEAYVDDAGFIYQVEGETDGVLQLTIIGIRDDMVKDSMTALSDIGLEDGVYTDIVEEDTEEDPLVSSGVVTTQSTGERVMTASTSYNTYVIQKSGQVVSVKSFYKNNLPGKLTLPATVKAIGSKAFYGCSTLGKLDIKGSGVKLGSAPFDNCQKLATILFGGTPKNASGGSLSSYKAYFSNVSKKVGVHVYVSGTKRYQKLLTPTLAYSTKTIVKTYGNSAFTNSTLQKKTDGKVTYKSSNTGVATVSSAGKVTIKGSGKATITATAAGTANYSRKSASYTLKVRPPKVTGITLTRKTKAFKASWTRTSKATGYQIQYSLKKDFSSKKTVTVTSYKTGAKTISSLKSGKYYYVRMRTYKKVGTGKYCSAWSAVKKVKTY